MSSISNTNLVLNKDTKINEKRVGTLIIMIKMISLLVSSINYTFHKLGYNPDFWTPLRHLLYIYIDVNQFATIVIILNYFKSLIKNNLI